MKCKRLGDFELIPESCDDDLALAAAAGGGALAAAGEEGASASPFKERALAFLAFLAGVGCPAAFFLAGAAAGGFLADVVLLESDCLDLDDAA